MTNNTKEICSVRGSFRAPCWATEGGQPGSRSWPPRRRGPAMYLPCSRSLLSISVIVLPRSETAGSQRARLRKGQDRRDRRATTESREKTLETHNPAAGLQTDPERPRPLVTSSDATPVLPRAAPNLGRAPKRGRAETQAPAARFTLPGSFRLCLLGGALQNWSRC